MGHGGELLIVTTLGEFDKAAIDMSCLVIVYARGTAETEQGQVWTPRFMADPTCAT